MRFKIMMPILASVFMAELGDKTQLATILFMAGGTAKAWQVFLAAGAALVTSTFLAVAFGAAISRIISPNTLKTLAGIAFLALGYYYIYQGMVA